MSELSFRRQAILQHAIESGLLHPGNAPIACFIDDVVLRSNVDALHRAFAGNGEVSHAFAVKSGSLPVLLQMLRVLGMRAEVASEGELEMALAAGHDSRSIVFDSPAKTEGELQRALDLGVHINVDNFQELARIAQRMPDDGQPRVVGFRINPQVGIGSIEAMSTAGAQSKFGVGIKDPGVRERVVEVYLSYPWMNSVQVHVGSQGVAVDVMVDGIREITELADEINERVGGPQVRTIDIGGGLPVDFHSDERPVGFGAYAQALRAGVPRLFSGDYRIVTEFGRSLLAKAGFIAAYVEYTKTSGDRPIAVTHAGAQIATRTVFMPDAWPLRVLAFTPDGLPKLGEPLEQDVAGPCCFAGDLIARGRRLPELEPGDLVVMPDTGAYYASTPFTYNSILTPGIYATRSAPTPDAAGAVQGFRPIREPQTMEALLRAAGVGLLE